ncbi:SusD/RagB family nutrient-binding outer membrane lipoprotein [Christiangramia echinicola]|uniref:SusD/RagB family nutrient-binding outer membrane lipoprotein n=1 Tax=Christiangramia echinicola TaxID=279359 RepID=UPI0009FD3931|nr:SusD/RagB family nutrient-binding outer membrane lipoprotein [Christiangramia echinicola]
MKTKKFLIKPLLMLFAVAAISCSEDMLDVNENPNNPSTSTPSLTLPVAQDDFVALNARSMTYLGQFMVYNWAVPSNWSANGDLIRYNITSNFFTNIFETSYVSIFKNLTYVENFTDPSGAVSYDAYDVIAQTLKGFQYQYLVDLYGDVPYTEANLRGENPTPAYDDSELIYKSVIDSLTNAANNALNLPENAEDPGNQDIIYGGDMTGWAQFANSVKLRMLVRMSNTGQDSYIQEQIASIMANGAGFITDNVVANPGYSDNAGQQNPFYGYVGVGPNGAALDRQDFTVATDYAIETLTDFNDPRLESLYSDAVNHGYIGAEQSTQLPGTGFTSDDLSHVGPGLLKSSDQDQPIMLLSEALFLQAEATFRGYLPGGEAAAKELYEQAIAASFEFLGAQEENVDGDLVDADPEEYYTQLIENVSWDASPNKIEAIITQKWIALNGTSSIESWVEWIRTGFPNTLPIPAESGGVRPVSLLYPVSEIARNSDNVPAQTPSDAFTNAPFWR